MDNTSTPTPVPPTSPAPTAPAQPQLSIVPKPASTATPAVGAAPAGEAKAAKILIVEDEEPLRVVFMDLLSSEGYEVSGAADGVEAIAKAAADKFDLMLLDIVMPNKDGIEVLQDIKADKAKYGDPIILMLTNLSGDVAVEKALSLGAAGYRLKNGTDPEDLVKDVKQYLSGRKDKSISGLVQEADILNPKRAA